MVNGTTGEPLSGTQVVVEGTGIGTVTDARGRFIALDVPSGARTTTRNSSGYGEESAADTPLSQYRRDQ